VEFVDYYKSLGIERSASQDEIQKAYRKLARKYHPDVSKAKDAESKFKEINEAHEVLKDPEKRKRYDALGANWKAGQEFRPPPGYENVFGGFGSGAGAGNYGQTFSFGGSGAGAFSDFFESLFGGQGFTSGYGADGGAYGYSSGGYSSASSSRPNSSRQGQSHEAEITVSLADAYHGAEKRIALETTEDDGSGRSHRSTKTYQVKIPAGVSDGSTIRLAGQGGAGSGSGKAGDLLLKVKIAPDLRFRVSGDDVSTTVSITPWEAVLGAKVEVETLDGKVTVSVPAGSQAGSKLRLRGKGMRKKGAAGVRGDMFAELKIVVPQQISAKEKELFQELMQESKFNPRS